MILVGFSAMAVSAGLFGPYTDDTGKAIAPTPTQVVQDTWAPVDKCYAYNPGVWDSGENKWITEPGFIYSITYVNQNGHHKIEQVGINIWYNTLKRNGIGTKEMYYQGGV